MPDELLPDSVTSVADTLLPLPLVCSWTDGGLDAAWVHLAGQLDIATTPQLRQTLLAPQLQARMVVLDLRELDFIDCAGVHAIVDASIRARHAGRRLVLLRGPPSVDHTFTLVGISDDLEIGEAGVSRPLPLFELVAPVGPPAAALVNVAAEDLLL